MSWDAVLDYTVFVLFVFVVLWPGYLLVEMIRFLIVRRWRARSYEEGGEGCE